MQTQQLVSLLIPWIILFGLMWFLIYRPQQIKNKKRTQMLSELRRGDRVVTIGGIHGTLTSLKDDVVHLRIADRVEVKMARSGIAHPVGADDEE